MNNENYWKQFVKSGKIEDYLVYAGCIFAEACEIKENIPGDNPYAGDVFCDRNGPRPESCR